MMLSTLTFIIAIYAYKVHVSFIYCQIIYIREKYNLTPENNDFIVENYFFHTRQNLFKNLQIEFIFDQISFVCENIYFICDKMHFISEKNVYHL